MTYKAYILGYDILQTQLNHYGIPCDVAYDFCYGIAGDFERSPQNNPDKSEYECLWDYVNDHMHEIESKIIELAGTHSEIPEKIEIPDSEAIEKLLKYAGCRNISELWDYIDFLEDKKKDLEELRSDMVYLATEKYN